MAPQRASRRPRIIHTYSRKHPTVVIQPTTFPPKKTHSDKLGNLVGREHHRGIFQHSPILSPSEHGNHASILTTAPLVGKVIKRKASIVEKTEARSIKENSIRFAEYSPMKSIEDQELSLRCQQQQQQQNRADPGAGQTSHSKIHDPDSEDDQSRSLATERCSLHQVEDSTLLDEVKGVKLNRQIDMDKCYPIDEGILFAGGDSCFNPELSDIEMKVLNTGNTSQAKFHPTTQHINTARELKRSTDDDQGYQAPQADPQDVPSQGRGEDENEKVKCVDISAAPVKRCRRVDRAAQANPVRHALSLTSTRKCKKRPTKPKIRTSRELPTAGLVLVGERLENSDSDDNDEPLELPDDPISHLPDHSECLKHCKIRHLAEVKVRPRLQKLPSDYIEYRMPVLQPASPKSRNRQQLESYGDGFSADEVQTVMKSKPIRRRYRTRGSRFTFEAKLGQLTIVTDNMSESSRKVRGSSHIRHLKITKLEKSTLQTSHARNAIEKSTSFNAQNQIRYQQFRDAETKRSQQPELEVTNLRAPRCRKSSNIIVKQKLSMTSIERRLYGDYNESQGQDSYKNDSHTNLQEYRGSDQQTDDYESAEDLQFVENEKIGEDVGSSKNNQHDTGRLQNDTELPAGHKYPQNHAVNMKSLSSHEDSPCLEHEKTKAKAIQTGGMKQGECDLGPFSKEQNLTSNLDLPFPHSSSTPQQLGYSSNEIFKTASLTRVQVEKVRPKISCASDTLVGQSRSKDCKMDQNAEQNMSQHIFSKPPVNDDVFGDRYWKPKQVEASEIVNDIKEKPMDCKESLNPRFSDAYRSGSILLQCSTLIKVQPPDKLTNRTSMAPLTELGTSQSLSKMLDTSDNQSQATTNLGSSQHRGNTQLTETNTPQASVELGYSKLVAQSLSPSVPRTQELVINAKQDTLHKELSNHESYNYIASEIYQLPGHELMNIQRDNSMHASTCLRIPSWAKGTLTDKTESPIITQNVANSLAIPSGRRLPRLRGGPSKTLATLTRQASQNMGTVSRVQHGGRTKSVPGLPRLLTGTARR